MWAFSSVRNKLELLNKVIIDQVVCCQFWKLIWEAATRGVL